MHRHVHPAEQVKPLAIRTSQSVGPAVGRDFEQMELIPGLTLPCYRPLTGFERPWSSRHPLLHPPRWPSESPALHREFLAPLQARIGRQ
jgi:hypothetical protein